MNESVKILLEVVDKATPELQKFQQNLQRTGSVVTAFASTIATAGVAAGAAFVAAVAGMVKQGAEAADEMGKMAQKVGISTEAMSGLAAAAELSDVGLDSLKTGVNQLNKSILEANDPASGAAAAFKYLGVEVKNADGSYRKADQIFADVATQMAGMPNDVNKSAVAMELFGKAGADMIPMLNGGAEGIRAATEEAQIFGNIVSDEAAKAAEEFNDNLTRLGQAGKGLSQQVSQQLIPIFNFLVESFVDVIKQGDLVKATAEGIGTLFKWITQAGVGVVFVFKSIGKAVGALAAAATMILSGDFEGAKSAMNDLGREVSDDAIKYADFNQKVKEGKPLIEKETEAVDKATVSRGNYTGAVGKNTKAKDEEAKAFEKAYAALLKESEGYKQMTAVQQVEYNIAQKVAGFRDADHQKKMLQLASELDKRRELMQLEAGRTNQLRQLYQVQEDAKAAEVESSIYLQDLLKNGIVEADRLAARRATEKSLNQELIQLGRELQALQDENPTKHAKRIADLQAEIDGRLEILNTSREQIDAINRINERTKQTADLNKLLADYIAGPTKRLNQLNYEYLQLVGMQGTAIASQRELNLAIEKADAARFAEMREQVTLLEKKTAEFAGQIQNTFGDVFYNIMQGNFKDIGTSFKQMLDKMVAEALAAQLARAIFGDFQRTGSVSGQGGGLLTSIMSSLGGSGWGGLIGGMFRAEGGPVTAGQPYIVGEKRAELFVPRTSGTILPDTSALAMAGGNSVQLSITAMDSQDVIRALDKIKRPLADMVNSTGRAYNMK